MAGLMWKQANDQNIHPKWTTMNALNYRIKWSSFWYWSHMNTFKCLFICFNCLTKAKTSFDLQMRLIHWFLLPSKVHCELTLLSAINLFNQGQGITKWRNCRLATYVMSLNLMRVKVKVPRISKIKLLIFFYLKTKFLSRSMMTLI